MKRAATTVLLLWISAFQCPLVGQAETSQSRFESLWTRKAAFSESEILALSEDTEPVARQFAVLRLAEIKSPSQAALAALARALGDPAEEVRWQALAGLMRLGRPATRMLAKMLSDLQPVIKADFEPMADFKPIGEETGEPETWPVSRADLAFAALLYARDVDVDALLSAYRAAPPEPRGTGDHKDANGERFGDFSDTRSVSPRERIRLVLERLPPQPLTPSIRAALRSKNRALRAAVEMMMEDEAEDYEIPFSASGEEVAALLKDPDPEVRLAALQRIQEPEPDDIWPDQCKHLKESPPELLVRFPAPALTKVTSLARGGDVPMREAAVEALFSLGCARPDLATAVVTALFARLSGDPDSDVSSRAAELFGKMMDAGFLPSSSISLDAVLAVLANSKRRSAHDPMLEALQHMELPENRRKELVGILVSACLDGSCSPVQKILSQRPDWLTAAIDSLVARYPDVQSYDFSAFHALADLGAEKPVFIREMERLLGHSDESLRLEAALALVEHQIISPQVLGVLEQEARHAGVSDGGMNAAGALADLGEQGLERLRAIISDPSTASRVRSHLKQTLKMVAAKAPQAPDKILAAASDPTNPAQLQAVRALDSLKSRMDEVRAALERAFSTGSTEVRQAVVEEWCKTGQAPGDLVERVLADPEVHGTAIQLARLLPQEDPRRLALTTAALQDKQGRNVGEWLIFAGELGEPGAALLARYVSSGQELTYDFFEGAQRLGSFGGALAAALEARLPAEPPKEQGQILDALAKAGATVNREPLYARLKAPDAVKRERAAHALLGLQEDPWAREGLLATVLTEVEVRNLVKQRLADALSLLSPEYFGGGDSGEPTFEGHWPQIPWPPPPGYRRPPEMVSRELLAASEKTTLGDVYKRLEGAIEAAGDDFEHALFLGPRDGFYLMARMERIKSNGTPFPEPARWTQEGSPKLNWMDFLADIFFEDPGYFREIVFAITDDAAPKPSAGTPLPDFKEGLSGIPSELRDYFKKPFGNKEVLVLVYTFERQQGARITPWEGDGTPSAKQHLEKAGIWSHLATSSHR